jgi:hypothetical protein
MEAKITGKYSSRPLPVPHPDSPPQKKKPHSRRTNLEVQKSLFSEVNWVQIRKICSDRF